MLLIHFLAMMSFISTSLQGQNKSFSATYYENILSIFKNKIQLNQTIQDTDEPWNKCQAGLNTYINTNNSTNVINIIDYSGRSNFDIGMEYQCTSSNYSYFWFLYKKIIPNITDSAKDGNQVIVFLNHTDYVYGLCIHPDCNDWIRSAGNINTSMYNAWTKEIFSSDSEKNITVLEAGARNATISWTVVIMYLFQGWLVLKFLAFCVIEYYDASVFKIGEFEKGIAPQLDDSFSFAYNEPDKQWPIFQSKQNHLEISNVKGKTQKNRCIVLCFQILNFWDIRNAILYLFRKQTKYYNDTNLEMMSFMKTVLVLWLIYNHNFYSMIKIPVKKWFNYEFFVSSKLILVKLSTFSCVCYIALEGFSTSFKLFSYIKKNISSEAETGKAGVFPNASVKHFLKFYCHVIPRFISTVLIFSLLAYNISSYDEYFSFPLMFQFFKTKWNNRQCVQDYSNLFNPIAFWYGDYAQNTNNEFVNCFKYINIMYNMHICFIFLLLVVYVSFRLKSKYFDFCFFALFTLLAIGFQFTWFKPTDELETTFNIHKFLGENYSWKYTHVFIVPYWCGVFNGIIYFYYKDVISPKPWSAYIKYNPVIFCYSFMTKIDSWSYIVKVISLISCLLVLAVQSTLYYIIIIVHDKWLFDFTKEYQVYERYEKVIFTFGFMTVLLWLLLHKENSSFKSVFYHSIIFRFGERISHVTFCSMDNMIYIWYTIYPVEPVLDFNNMLLWSIGLICVISCFNWIIYILIEQPVRMWVKEFVTSVGEEPKEVVKGKVT